MLRFEEPQYLYLLALIPLIAILRYALVMRQRKKLAANCDLELVKELMPDASKWRPVVKFWLLEAVLALVIVVVARPQSGNKVTTNEKRMGIETVIAVDVSNSMYAEDVKPSRLDRTKMIVENLIDRFTDDKIGLIVFAGDAFVQLPITSDYVSAKLFLSSIDPSMINVQGTDMARAIDMAAHSFTKQEGIGRAIIVITDGEDHEGGTLEAAEKARKEGMNVFVLGVGSTKGSPIRIPGTHDYMRDNKGETVMTALNTDMCKEVARAGGGAFIHVENGSRAEELLDEELSKLAQQEISSTLYSEYSEQFQAVCLIAIILLIIETCLLNRKNPLFKGVSLFARRAPKSSVAAKTLLLVLLMSSAATVQAQNARDYIREGNRHFRNERYEEAEKAYLKALAKDSLNPQALYNLGNALMVQKKDSAVNYFMKAADEETNPYRKALAYHNIGVMFQSNEKYDVALEAYKDALRNNPKDDESRYNLEICKQQLKRQPKKPEQQNQGNKQDEKKEKNTKERMERMKQQVNPRRLQKNW